MFDKLRDRLIADWRQAWRYWSVQIPMGGAALSAAWAMLPPDTRATIPGAQWIGLVLFLAAGLSRYIDQGKNRG